MEEPYAVIGRNPTAAASPTDQQSTIALAVVTPVTGPSAATKLNRARALTPYNPEAWCK